MWIRHLPMSLFESKREWLSIFIEKKLWFERGKRRKHVHKATQEPSFIVCKQCKLWEIGSGRCLWLENFQIKLAIAEASKSGCTISDYKEVLLLLRWLSKLKGTAWVRSCLHCIEIIWKLRDYKCCIFIYIITQVIHAFWLVLAYDLLEDRRTIDVIITKFLTLPF